MHLILIFFSALMVNIGVFASALAKGDKALSDRYWKVTDSQKNQPIVSKSGFCEGRYVKPIFQSSTKNDDSEEPVTSVSTNAEYLLDGRLLLDGKVELKQGSRKLSAGRAILDTETMDAFVSRGVLFEEPFVAIKTDSAEVNIRTDAILSPQVEFFLFGPKIRGQGASFERNEKGTVKLTNSRFTRCEPGNNSWWIRARSMSVKQGEVFGTARNATLKVKGVPIFYTPFIKFPVTGDRQSGFLFPTFGYSGEEGLDLQIPYYFNIAPNYDAIISPRYISQRGLGLDFKFRHLSTWQQTSFSLSALPNDDLFDGRYKKEDFDTLVNQGGLVDSDFDSADRWAIGIRHRGKRGRLTTLIDYAAVSDPDYFRDFGASMQVSDRDLQSSRRIDLERRGEIQYRHGDFFARVWLQRFQRLDDYPIEPYQRLPEIELSYGGRLGSRFEYNLGVEWVSFTRDRSKLSSSNAVVGSRLHVEPRLRIPFNWTWGFFNVGGGLRYTNYSLDYSQQTNTVQHRDKNPDRSIAFGSAEGGLYFDKEVALFGVDLVSTMEPRIYYLYQQYADQDGLPRFDVSEFSFRYDQLFRDNRFTGLDRIGDANQLGVGLTSRLVNAKTGREYLRASVGQIRYFRDRKVVLYGNPRDEQSDKVSALAGELNWSISRRLLARGSIVWDTSDGRVEEAFGEIRYRSDNRHIFSVGYRLAKKHSINQPDFSLYWPVSKRMSVIGRWNYDFKSKRTVEALAGIEYNDCCWQIRLVGRHFLDAPHARLYQDIEADKGIFLQFVFKGLAGFGGSVETLMRHGVRGYNPEINNEM